MVDEPRVQIVRDGAELWTIWRISPIDNTSDVYERIARVIMGGDRLYHIERPEWLQNDVRWIREARGYATQNGAFHAVLHPKPPPVAYKQ